MKFKSFLWVLGLFLVLVNVSAITIDKDVVFITSGNNASYIIGSNMTLDSIEVASDYVYFNEIYFSVNGNLTIFNVSKTYVKFDVNLTSASDLIVGNLTVSRDYSTTQNAVALSASTSNASGFITYSNLAVGNHSFILERNALSVAEAEETQIEQTVPGGRVSEDVEEIKEEIKGEIKETPKEEPKQEEKVIEEIEKDFSYVFVMIPMLLIILGLIAFLIIRKK